MRELALNVLDIVENSLAAGAKLVKVALTVRLCDDFLSISIEDDGCGMDETTLAKACDPFTTSRTTRNVGLGLPLFRFSAESAGGAFSIESKRGEGTRVEATYRIGHIDRMPLGAFGGVVLQMVTMNERVDFYITVSDGEQTGVLDTREIKEILGDISLTDPEVRAYLKEYIQENLVSVYGGKL